jgi:hypothetical protein
MVRAAVLAGGLVAPRREVGVAVVGVAVVGVAAVGVTAVGVTAAGPGAAPARARGPGLEFVARNDLVVVTR